MNEYEQIVRGYDLLISEDFQQFYKLFNQGKLPMSVKALDPDKLDPGIKQLLIENGITD